MKPPKLVKLGASLVNTPVSSTTLYGEFAQLEIESTQTLSTFVRQRAAETAFGGRVIQNNFHSVISEIIVEKSLQPEWLRCSWDWNGWDLEHVLSGTRLEVKQSAILQTWGRPIEANPRFDIAPRTGYFEDSKR